MQFVDRQKVGFRQAAQLPHIHRQPAQHREGGLEPGDGRDLPRFGAAVVPVHVGSARVGSARKESARKESARVSVAHAEEFHSSSIEYIFEKSERLSGFVNKIHRSKPVQERIAPAAVDVRSCGGAFAPGPDGSALYRDDAATATGAGAGR